MSYSIAFLGPHGTFTEEALYALTERKEEEQESNITLLPKASIQDTLQFCEDGHSSYAFVPIENSIEGSVHMTLDWFSTKQTDLQIQAEMLLPIQQMAMIHPQNLNCSPTAFVKVYSHPHAVAQCQNYLHDHFTHAHWEYTKSTAEAAEWLRKHPEEKAVAIGNRWAATMNELHILQEDVQDYDNNYTRFVLVGKEEWKENSNKEEHYKTSILVTLPKDYPGALYQVLAAFSWRKLNLSRIESRPTKRGLGSYYFFLDVEHHQNDEVLLPGALAEIEALGCGVRFLGSFPSFIKKI